MCPALVQHRLLLLVAGSYCTESERALCSDTMIGAKRITIDASVSTTRDRRIDLLRGMALLAVFIDHIPGNVLHLLTLQSHAVSDAADIFVFLAGYSAWLAHERVTRRGGAGVGVRRLLAQCGRIYAMQLAVILTCFVVASMWLRCAGMPPGPVLEKGRATLVRALVLYAQPAYFDVLPLYVCLLLLFPLIWVGLCRRPGPTLAVSAGLWLLTNLHVGLDLPEWLSGQGWTFNPFEWQFLFTLGALAAAANTSWRLPLRRSPSIAIPCWVFLAEVWLLLQYGQARAPGPGSAAHLAGPADILPHLMRLLSGLAIMYLVLTSSRFERLARSGRLLAIEVCGKHSLALFGLGSVLSLVGRLTFRTAGDGALAQALVNGIGICTLIATADLLERRRQQGGARQGFIRRLWHPGEYRRLSYPQLAGATRWMVPDVPGLARPSNAVLAYRFAPALSAPLARRPSDTHEEIHM